MPKLSKSKMPKPKLKMQKPKISFLIAAHNEEKIIGITLNHLLKIPYENYEVILGLDGCTDKTEEIVKRFCEKSNKIKYYTLNLRQGKPAVIDEIIKKAKGEIVAINDADWLFLVKDKKAMEEFLSVFKNPKVGGIAESFPLEWHEDRLRNSNLGYKMDAYSAYFWYSYQKKRFAYKKNPKEKILYIKNPTMFLTNVFRKKLYSKNFSLADDFERTKNIVNKGYEVVLLQDSNLPRIKSVYNKVLIKDLFKQKVRTAIARSQLNEEKVFDVNMKNYYLPSVLFIFTNSWKMGFGVGLITTFWIFLTAFATFIAKFKKTGTKEGWKMRAER